MVGFLLDIALIAKYKAKKRNAIGVPFSFDKKSNYLAADAAASAT